MQIPRIEDIKGIDGEIILTAQQVKKFEDDYKITADMQKTCGQIIFGIIKNKGMEKNTKFGIDVRKIVDLTGLNDKIIYLLKNPDCALNKQMVVSFAIGLELDVHATAYLLAANGMVFNTNNKVDKAYVYLIEQHKGRNIEDCNIILGKLGIAKKYFLGSQERGEYNTSKDDD